MHYGLVFKLICGWEIGVRLAVAPVAQKEIVARIDSLNYFIIKYLWFFISVLSLLSDV
jgi:hypothetical protein